VSVAQFATPGQAPRRLISVQRVAGELDAVELKAWHDMMRVLTHEMMNSLTPIASLAESLQVLESERWSSELAPSIEAIGRRSRGLLQFVEGYRKVADLPRVRIELLDAAHFCVNLERLLLPMFESHGVAYRCELLSVGDFRADASLLEQALINLLHNALDAVRAVAQPSVTLTCRTQGERLCIAVADNGVGVDQVLRAQLFVPFHSTKAGGSGIGLSLARNIARAHGGSLTFDANQPAGSVFTLSLPN
jgi:two-component system nitrogen regulation sensor histidine kinase NtrY